MVATALDDATRQAFEEEKRNIASQKRAAQTTSITKLSTGRSSVSTDTTPYVSAASTSTGANAGESSFVYLGGKTNLLADFNNMNDTINVSPIPTLRIHKKHPKDQILGDPKSAVQTRRQFKSFLQHRQALQQPDGIFIIVGIILADILKKFDFWSIRTATTPIESNKPLVKDEDVKMFQVTPKASYLNAVKRIFRFLKHQPKLGLWYPTDSPFELEAFSATNCCGRVLWIQNQMMDYGFNFMNTKIHIDNESTISVIKNHVAHSRTKHIEIRFHFIRDCFEKRLLEVIKIHTDHNVADLLTKGFDVTRFNFGYITVKVAGNPANISKASIRSDLLFDDADGIDSLHTQAIFDVIQIMGHLDAKKKFVMYPRLNQLKNVPVPLNHFPINALTTKVFSFMVKKGKSFSGNVTPLFPSMLAQPTEDEGAVSERPSETQPTPSPPHPSADQHETQPDPSPRPSPTIPIPDSIPEGSGGNHGGQSSSDRSLSGNEDGLTLQSVYDLCVSLCKQVTTQAAQIKDLKSQIKQLKKKAKPVISHHNAWIKSVSIKKRLARKKSLKKKWMQKESVSKQGRKSAKSTPTAHTDQVFDDVDVNDAMDYMETDAYMQKGVSTEDQVSTVKPDEGTDKPKVSTDKPEVSTAKPKEVEVSTDKLDEGTAEPKDGTSDESTAPTTVFRDDETIAEFLVSMSQNKAKQKGVEIKDAEDSDRPRATSTRSVLTLKPLPKIDPKDKGKKVLEEEAESDAESEGVDEAERKFDQLAKDEEIARKVQEDWEAEEEMKKLAEEEATKAALIQDFDDIQARIEADRLLAARLQEEERETFTVEERAKFLYDTIAAQRRFLAQQRAAAIRSRPPTRTQLRNQMMTYLKHVGGKKHADLKNKNFEEIQVLYKEVKRSDKNFIAIGSAEDERQIKEMNEESKDPKKKRLKKRVVNETPREEDTAKVPAEQEVTEQGTKKRKSGHVKMIARKRPRPQPDDDSDDEHRKCLRIVTFDSTIDSEIMETKSFVSKLHKVSSPDGDYLVVYRVNGHFRAFNYLMEVLHIFDRQDLFHLYDLVMKQYSEITPEGIELILWGDLKIMMESSIEENDQGDFWNNQQDWEIVSWRLYEACGVCILELKDGTIIYMLVERRYPLSKELLQRMLDLGLEVEEEVLLHYICEELASPGSNSSWLSIYLVVYNEGLDIPEQTATGKGISNPLRAGSLLKTTKPTLYLMRRSLEVLRKFHWMILGGRFNMLSDVSSPLLSKPGEY
ncbi:hypothetical protein Tco_0793884 [Tanacetum coccineum]